MNLLDLTGKTFLVFGASTRRSVASHVVNLIERAGGRTILAVHTATRRETISALFPTQEIHVCDLADDEQIAALAAALARRETRLDGFVHSVAYANYANFSGNFHEVSRADFLQCVSISCYSLMAIANALRNLLTPTASVVTISISTTRMAVEAYGYMAPAKAALDSAVVFLAKSFSAFSEVRFNAVSAGLLKTNSSAGIPGYVDHYLFAEQVIPRKRALSTDEVANTVLFLLSPMSSGVNAQCVVVDAAMGVNYFDPRIIGHTIAAALPVDPRP